MPSGLGSEHIIDDHREGWSEDWKHHQTFTSFEDSVDDGCVMCNVAWDSWEALHIAKDESSPKQDSFRLSCRFYCTQELSMLPVQLAFSANVGEEKLEQRDFIKLTIRRSRQPQVESFEEAELDENVEMAHKPRYIKMDVWLHYFAGPNQVEIQRKAFRLGCDPRTIDREPTTDSESATKLAGTWLKQTPSGFMPTRLLDIDTGDDNIIRLHTTEKDETGIYATLSHCWGKNKIPKLTIGNDEPGTKEELENGYAIEKMPKTFREAIQVARHMSLKYLWIDSLCIIQDSVEDWKHESAIMGKIYMEGFLNIAATVASDGFEGLFQTRNPISIHAPHLKINVSCKNNGPTIMSNSEIYFIDPDFWETGIEDAILNTRGWEGEGDGGGNREGEMCVQDGFVGES